MELAAFVSSREHELHQPSSRFTYLKCSACDAGCDMKGTMGEPCYGRVLFVADYGRRRHLCQGHDDPSVYRQRP
jgi:hypothetical protein